MADHGAKPTHSVYSFKSFIERGEEGDGSWFRVGSENIKIGDAWVHKDGRGFDVKLEALPVNGQFLMRLNDPTPST